jgi:type II secretory pathway pseudopilin PulG
VSSLDDFDLETHLLTADDGGGPSGPYLQKADDLNDPWGTPYSIRIPGEVNYDFDIVSAGEDRKFDTEDDVTN